MKNVFGEGKLKEKFHKSVAIKSVDLMKYLDFLSLFVTDLWAILIDGNFADIVLSHLSNWAFTNFLWDNKSEVMTEYEPNL